MFVFTVWVKVVLSTYSSQTEYHGQTYKLILIPAALPFFNHSLTLALLWLSIWIFPSSRYAIWICNYLPTWRYYYLYANNLRGTTKIRLFVSNHFKGSWVKTVKDFKAAFNSSRNKKRWHWRLRGGRTEKICLRLSRASPPFPHAATSGILVHLPFVPWDGSGGRLPATAQMDG